MRTHTHKRSEVGFTQMLGSLTYAKSLDYGKAVSSFAARLLAQARTVVQPRRSLAGSLPASKLIGKRSFAGSYLPPNISRATGVSQGNFASSLSS